MLTWSVFIIFFSCSIQCWSFTFEIYSSQAGFHRVDRQVKSCEQTERLCQSGECYPERVFCDGNRDCPDGSDEILSNCKNETFEENVCGKKNSKGTPLIIGGAESHIGEYPWHVGIYIKKRTISTVLFYVEKYFEICGGSIISPKLVISAAHCFESREPSEYNVAAGKYYKVWNDKRDTNAQQKNVEKIVIPEIYKGLTHNYMNDIAILVMDKSFVFNNFVRPVCVDWTSELHKQAFKSESTGYISGWGVQEEPDGNLGETILFGDLNAELKHFQLPFVPSDTCLKEVPVDFKPIVNQSDKICAGTDGYKLCEIDGGAGLTFELDGSFYLMGVASVGPINCNTVKYTTFTNVSSHEQWVKNIYQTTDLTNSTQD